MNIILVILILGNLFQFYISACSFDQYQQINHYFQNIYFHRTNSELVFCLWHSTSLDYNLYLQFKQKFRYYELNCSYFTIGF